MTATQRSKFRPLFALTGLALPYLVSFVGWQAISGRMDEPLENLVLLAWFASLVFGLCCFIRWAVAEWRGIMWWGFIIPLLMGHVCLNYAWYVYSYFLSGGQWP